MLWESEQKFRKRWYMGKLSIVRVWPHGFGVDSTLHKYPLINADAAHSKTPEEDDLLVVSYLLELPISTVKENWPSSPVASKSWNRRGTRYLNRITFLAQ